MNILLVDDEVAILDVLIQLLEIDYPEATVYTAENGQQALGIERNIDLDIIITDYKMPIMNGIEMIEQIKDSGRNKDTKIIFISGYIPDLKDASSQNDWDDIILLDKVEGILKVTNYIKILLNK